MDFRDLDLTEPPAHWIPKYEAPKARPTNGSQARYEARKRKFERDGDPQPRLRHHALWLLHNCVAHPLLALGKRPHVMTVELHELTSQWLNQKMPTSRGGAGVDAFYSARFVVATVPREIKNRRAWVVHNVLAHLAIGLLPCETTFKYHDKTADEMGVPGWV